MSIFDSIGDFIMLFPFVISGIFCLFSKNAYLTSNGRIDRQRFAFRTVATLIPGFIYAASVVYYPRYERDPFITIFIFLLNIPLSLAVWYQIFNILRRVNDLNFPFLIWIPIYAVARFLNIHSFIFLLAILALCILPGTKGTNKHGADPLEENPPSPWYKDPK